MAFQDKLEQLKITAKKILEGRKTPEESLPVVSKDFNDLLEVLKDIETDGSVINLVQEVVQGDEENAPSGGAVFQAIEDSKDELGVLIDEKQDIPTTSDVTGNIWDFSGSARQRLVANEDKVISVENLTDSVKVLEIIHTSVQRTITIHNKVFIIAASTTKVSVITGTVFNNNLFISSSPEVFDYVDLSTTAEFPTTNRLGLWKMSSLNVSGSNVVSWDDSDGGGLVKRWIRASSPGPVYSPTEGVSFSNNINMYRESDPPDPDGITLGFAFTMYALIKKTGDGSLIGLYAGQYLLYLTNSSINFKPQDTVLQQNPIGIPNMSDYQVLALSYEGGTSAAKVYVDGEMIGFFTPQITPTEETRLYYLYGNGDTFNGYLKGFSFFSEAHSDLDIATNSPLFKTLAES